MSLSNTKFGDTLIVQMRLDNSGYHKQNKFNVKLNMRIFKPFALVQKSYLKKGSFEALNLRYRHFMMLLRDHTKMLFKKEDTSTI